MYSGNDLIELARHYIHETVADFWNPTRILLNLNLAQKNLVLKMQRKAERVFYTSCTIPTVSGTRNYSLPDGTLYSTAKKCTGHIDFIHIANEFPLPKDDYRLFYGTTTGKPYRIALFGNYISFDPIPSGIYSYILHYWYFPDAIVASSAAIDFLEGFEDMIALECAKIALMKEEADLSDIRIELAQKWKDFEFSFCGARIEGQPDNIPDDIYDDIDD